MLRKDFETGGFPLSRVAPVICFDSKGELHIAYDNTSLKGILDTGDIKQCIGVWPGKKNTDCFTLSTQHYGKKVPPKGYENIDHADEITLIYTKDGVCKITYTVYALAFDPKPFSVSNKDLEQYIISMGLKHKVIYI